MKNVWTICWRELKAYFVSPIAYGAGALFLLINGFLFSLIVTGSQEASLRSVMQNTMFILLLFAPALTMKLIADEQRMGTIELLLTAPVRDWQIVVGKFLGSLITYVVILLGPTLYYVALLAIFGQPDYGPIITSYIGIVLLGASFLSIGLFSSSLTQNQIIAYFAGLVILLMLWVADAANSSMGLSGSIGDALTYIAIPHHFDDFFRGIVDTRDVVYALSVITVSLFLATQVLQSRRWR
jgi:gliding motility-associated transport system permease protein